MKKILVLSRGYDAVAKGFGELVYNAQEFLDAPEEFILVQFTGGEDVSPELYGHTSPKYLCGSNPFRDAMEQQIFELALAHGVAMAGICRGSQFLNVMNGGVMIHDLHGHTFGHEMTTVQGEYFPVTSTHHQMSIPTDKAVLIAWSATNRSAVYIGDKDEPFDYKGPEVESFFYPETRCFGAQYHPEYMADNSRGLSWYREAIENLLKLTADQFVTKYTEGKTQQMSA